MHMFFCEYTENFKNNIFEDEDVFEDENICEDVFLPYFDCFLTDIRPMFYLTPKPELF